MSLDVKSGRTDNIVSAVFNTGIISWLSLSIKILSFGTDDIDEITLV
jgi:hypothetical protein